MIILCNGLAKSGSSFIFQIADNLAESAGFKQKQLRDQYIPDSFIPYKPHPHFVTVPPDKLPQWAQSIPPSQLLVVKTHDSFTPQASSLLASGKIKVINSYRNPRDAAVSLWDSALQENLAIDKENRRFAIPSFQAAIMITAHLSSVNAEWIRNRHTLNIGFQDISNNPFGAATTIANHLQLDNNSFTIISKYLMNRKRIREYNIGLSGRYKTYMNLFEEGWSNQLFGNYDKLTDTMHNEKAC